MSIGIISAEAGISTHNEASVTCTLSYFHGYIPTPHQSAIFELVKGSKS